MAKRGAGSPVAERVAEARSDDTASVDAALTALQRDGILVPRPAEVREYLLRYPDMAHPVVVACKASVERFRANAQLSLELYRDPEIDDQYLALYVRQEAYEDGILDKIRDTRDGYRALFGGSSGYFLLTTDFDAPR